ncbi:MAG: hypothetical protein H8D34_28410 [Chloroflexi bacterium]|nr:hypothetical protein [Chloroflexota bacterium]
MSKNTNAQSLLKSVETGVWLTQVIFGFLQEKNVKFIGWLRPGLCVVEYHRGWYMVWDNGGEIGVGLINAEELPGMVPTETTPATTAQTVALRIFTLLKGEAIDWEFEIEGDPIYFND